MTKTIIVFLALTTAALVQAAEADQSKAIPLDSALIDQMRKDYAQARHLERNENRLEDAMALLEKYDDVETVPEDLRLQVLKYRIWGTFASRRHDEALRLFHHLLDVTLPDGWSKELHVAYGPDERHRLDLYLPQGATKPSPVLVLIHGGGWAHGSQTEYPIMQRDLVQQVLARGGAVASITYRYVQEHKLPAPLHDSARAVQFLRANAAKYNLDKTRFVAMGDSAGGCNTLWLATHNDLADPGASDPILRESTRVQGAVGVGAQTTVDPADMKAGGILEALNHGMFAGGLKYPKQKLKTLDIDAETQALIDYCSPVKHLDAHDPPIFLNYVGPLDRTDEGVHHPRLGLLFKKRAEAVGAPCTLSVRHEPDYPNAPANYILNLLGLE